MKIELKKFGDLLTSRQDGREALAAIEPLLRNMSENEVLDIDFEGVTTFTPSWADEFITNLIDRFGNRVHFVNDENLSVKTTLELLKKLRLGNPRH
ncbi:STAS-like domain-containing protein [candidate division WWE3 bacterium]|uniref:STAS-like domain-containing protein n=1 Tax=candidate division WWE3 bacterium TaxID=2053526 RepID=A0A7X9HSB1_UNCKA|nr:STAS-like domain-containing protein [candidate division WWE3 bacterium]